MSMRLTMTAMLAAVVGLSLFGCGREEAPEQPPAATPDGATPGLEILAHTAGEAEAFEEETHMVIQPGQTPENVPDEVLAMRDDAVLPADEETTQVLVLFWALGEKQTAGYGLKITSAEMIDGTLTVTAHIDRPGEDEMAAQVLTYPYAAAAIPEVTYEDVAWNIRAEAGLETTIEQEAEQAGEAARDAAEDAMGGGGGY